MQLRPATDTDLEWIIPLATQSRHRRAEWAPSYFRPHPDADELHPLFLQFMVGSDDHDTQVVESAGDPFAFFARLDQPAHTWIDDLVVTDESAWPAVAEVLVEAERGPWVTCVAADDDAQRGGMLAAGVQRRSSYFARLLDAPDKTTSSGDTAVAAPPASDQPELAAVHTFGGEPFSPTTPGALVIDDGPGGYVVGSPSYTPPPVYDPGGPTTVVDRVQGPNRSELVVKASAAAAARGDAQLVVVCDDHDIELEQVLAGLDFSRVVDVMGNGHG